VSDAVHGPLLTGPTYPESFNTYDGQGIPDAFNLSPLREPASKELEVLIIGVGLCDLAADQVLDFSPWEVEQKGARLRMKTAQGYQRYGLELERVITLEGRTVRTSIHVANTGAISLPLRWFPHPFFPQPPSGELCRFNIPVSFPDNPGYYRADSGFIHRKAEPDQVGFYLPFDHEAHAPLVVVQRHPALGLVAATFSYTPCFFPIWGNHNTFSWEPFLERSVAPGQSTQWSVSFDF
jgi:hypothetical protein